ncbi:Putative transposase of IS4/5 family, partial [Hymenobacter daecheongensis DSM 21074]
MRFPKASLEREDNYLSVNYKEKMHRHEITDRQWGLVAPLLPGKTTDCGVTAADNRLFFNAVVWLLRTGAAWADLPERFGKPNSVCRRFRRLAQKGVWEAV